MNLYSITETKEIKQKVKELIDSKVEEKHED